MGLNDTQIRQLKAKLDPTYIKTRNSNGSQLSYIEGWHAIAEANRIFGHDAWDRRTIATTCVWSAMRGGNHLAAYTAKVRVTVRAGDVVVVREGSGSGEATSPTPGQAHELALKGAETDATKRALATFGNPFGLALYDRDQTGVKRTKGPPAVDKSHSGPWVLRSGTGAAVASYEKPADFVEGLRRTMSGAHDIELLYNVWEQNIEVLRAVHRSPNGKPGIVPEMVRHLRACAVALVRAASKGSGSHQHQVNEGEDPDRSVRQRIDKSVLTIAEPKRIRCKEHLRFVASQPCLICGRSPSHAHHVRHAQSRGLSLKVSDEFTVPLCAIHHHHVHTTGKEKEWWQERKIDPLKVAGGLWQKSRKRHPDPLQADTFKSLEFKATASSANDCGTAPEPLPAVEPSTERKM
jgi:DNA recombination protein Rad52